MRSSPGSLNGANAPMLSWRSCIAPRWDGMSEQEITMSVQTYPPPGQLVDVGGYRLHIICAGEGGPTVVPEAGLIGLALSWSLVQPEVAKFTRVCAYDRAGYGWSDPNLIGIHPTSQRLVHELHTLLVNASIAGPYVLVAHSFGGLNVRLFANQYPNDVIGVVLIDSANEFVEPRFIEAGRKSLLESVTNNLRFQVRLTQSGIARWLLRQLIMFTTPALKKISPELRAMWLNQYLDPKNPRVAVQESVE